MFEYIKNVNESAQSLVAHDKKSYRRHLVGVLLLHSPVPHLFLCQILHIRIRILSTQLTNSHHVERSWHLFTFENPHFVCNNKFYGSRQHKTVKGITP